MCVWRLSFDGCADTADLTWLWSTLLHVGTIALQVGHIYMTCTLLGIAETSTAAFAWQVQNGQMR